MKRKFLPVFFTIIFTLIFSIILLGDNCCDNCFSLVVGKEASSDGSVILGHNEDDRGDFYLNIRRIKRIDKPSEYAYLYNGKRIKTYPFRQELLWFELPETTFGDSFINESSVVIVSDACASRESKNVKGDISYMLRRLVAERAKTAREGVEIMGQLVENHGYDSNGRTYIIADNQECWFVSIVRGKHWIAQRVPDDSIAVIPNHYTIRKINLEDKKNFMGSKDIIGYAKKKGWYNPKEDGEFDFSEAYSFFYDKKNRVNKYRHWRALNLLTQKKWSLDKKLPFSAVPSKKISPAQVMKVLRDHYEGTKYDTTDDYKKGSPNITEYRPICVRSTKYSMVVQLRSDLPRPISTLTWFTFGKPDTSVYIPIHYGINPLPENFGFGKNNVGYKTLIKKHKNPLKLLLNKNKLTFSKVKKIEDIVERKYGERIKLVRKYFDKMENNFFKINPYFERTYIKIYNKNKESAQNFLNLYFNGIHENLKSTIRKINKELESLH